MWILRLFVREHSYFIYLSFRLQSLATMYVQIGSGSFSVFPTNAIPYHRAILFSFLSLFGRPINLAYSVLSDRTVVLFCAMSVLSFDWTCCKNRAPLAAGRCIVSLRSSATSVPIGPTRMLGSSSNRPINIVLLALITSFLAICYWTHVIQKRFSERGINLI